jgi:hypothetical protein
MKRQVYLPIVVFLAILMSFSGLSGQAQEAAQCVRMVSFTAKVKSENATKDGAYIHGYVVDMSPAEFRKLVGKKVRITGEVVEVEGVDNQEGNEIVQGRAGEWKYIKSPDIEILGKKSK